MAGVGGAGERQVSESKLLDVAQTLVVPTVDHRLLIVTDGQRSVNGISDAHRSLPYRTQSNFASGVPQSVSGMAKRNVIRIEAASQCTSQSCTTAITTFWRMIPGAKPEKTCCGSRRPWARRWHGRASWPSFFPSEEILSTSWAR